MADADRQRQFDAWKSRLLQAAVDDFEVVMTAIKSEDRSIMRLERLPKALVDYSKVHYVGGGPYKGILINKQAIDLEEVMTEEARLEFLAYLSKQDNEDDHTQDYWILKFWFQGTADGLKRKRIFTDYFQELMNPKNFPKNYIGFVKRALVLLKKYDQIRRVDFVVQKSTESSEEEELPPIKSFVTVYTPDSYTYQLVPEVQVNNKSFLTFKLKAGGDAHVSLSAVYGDLQRKSHEIVIGAENNSKSMIREGSLGITRTEAITFSILHPNEFRYFWISWANNEIEVGRGAKYGQGRFLHWKVPENKRFNVNCLAVSTGRSSRGQWEFAELLGQMPNMVVPQMRATESKKLFAQNPPVDDGTPRIFRTQSMMTIPSKGAGPRKVKRPVSQYESSEPERKSPSPESTSIQKYTDELRSSNTYNSRIKYRNPRIFRTQSSLVISGQRPRSDVYSGTVTNTKVVSRPWTGSQVITETWTNSRVVPDLTAPIRARPKTWVATPAFQRPCMDNIFESWKRREAEEWAKYKDDDQSWINNYDQPKKNSAKLDEHWKTSTLFNNSVQDKKTIESLWSSRPDYADVSKEKWASHTYSLPNKPDLDSNTKRWSSCQTLPQAQVCYCNPIRKTNPETATYKSEFHMQVKPKNRNEYSMLEPSDGDVSLKDFKMPQEKSSNNPDFDYVSAEKAARKQKAKMSLLWLAKRQRLIQVLEDAYPNSVQVSKLLQTCKIKHVDMIAAVVMLKDMEKKGLIKEMANGLWMRIPKGPTDTVNDIEMVDKMPMLNRRDHPEIAIITALYCEKLAVDAMMEDKKTFVKYKTEGYSRRQFGESQVYTLGRIGDYKVVSTKLSRLGSGRNAMISAENTTTRLLGTFNHVEHVFLVGVGGAVPHFSDFNKHVRLGDVVVSTPVNESQTLYMQCTKVESVSGSSGYSYVTRSFSCIDQTLRLAVQNLKRDLESGTAEKTFESYIEEAKERLNSEESSFHRPSIKSDKLFLVKPDGQKIQMEHPRPAGTLAKLHREGQPVIRYGVIGAGRFVARNDNLRREFAEMNGIKSYDAEYDAVLQSLEGNRNDSLLVIRGMADYLDGSNKDWQPYAALVAAAYMKAIITSMR